MKGNTSNLWKNRPLFLPRIQRNICNETRDYDLLLLSFSERRISRSFIPSEPMRNFSLWFFSRGKKCCTSGSIVRGAKRSDRRLIVRLKSLPSSHASDKSWSWRGEKHCARASPSARIDEKLALMKQCRTRHSCKQTGVNFLSLSLSPPSNNCVSVYILSRRDSFLPGEKNCCKIVT